MKLYKSIFKESYETWIKDIIPTSTYKKAVAQYKKDRDKVISVTGKKISSDRQKLEVGANVKKLIVNGIKDIVKNIDYDAIDAIDLMKKYAYNNATLSIDESLEVLAAFFKDKLYQRNFSEVIKHDTIALLSSSVADKILMEIEDEYL